MSVSKYNVLKNIDNIKVSSNEYLTKYTFWRNFQKLLENDVDLNKLYDTISESIQIGMYDSGYSYRFGEIVWYLPESKDKIIILRSIIDDNKTYPEANKRSYIENGWEPLSLDVDIYSTDIISRLNGLVFQTIKKHQDDCHPYGVLTKDNIDDKLLKKDLSNANSKRTTFLFPYVTGFLPKNINDNVIINGAYRYYDNGLLEYDIIYKFGSVGTIQKDGTQYEGLTCNNVSFTAEYDNSRYFYNDEAYKIFASQNNSSKNQSIIDNTLQMNRNDFVNTYFAQINLPIAFMDTKYMVFSSGMMSQDNNTSQNYIKPGKNAITFCRKTRKSITAILVTYPNGNWNDEGYNATHGGLASNSFRCKIVGRAKPRDE